MFPRELSQQQVLVKSQISTQDQMTKIDNESKIKESIVEKDRAAIGLKYPIRVEDREESSSSSFVNILNSDQEYPVVSSHRSPTLIEAPLPEHLEEVHSSLVTEKILSERHSVVQEEESPSSYNIEETFQAFTFNL